MDNFWVIGDVAGEYDALMELVGKLPSDAKLVFVGDLNDRGPKTKEVIQWVKDSGHVALMGNHESMFIDYVKGRHLDGYTPQYEDGVFLYNGGIPTLRSYLMNSWEGWRPSKDTALVLDHIEWLEKRPVKFELDNVIVTHAPIAHGNIKKFDRGNQLDQIWNRDWISPNDKFQFFGHNGHYREYVQYTELGVDRLYAICVDDSRNNRLTAVNWPTLEKVEVNF